MQPRKIKIGVITSNISLHEFAKKNADKLNYEVLVSPNSLEKAVPIGKQMEQEGVEVIISRAGTAYMLAENLNIPVVSVPAHSLDLIKCLKEAAALGSVILLLTFKKEIIGLEVIEEILRIRIIQGIYRRGPNLKETILSGKRQGCEVVVGGRTALRIAGQYGLKEVEIQISEDIMAAMIENAKSAALSNWREREKTQRYRYIMDSVSEGIIATDQKGQITTINETARDLLKIYDSDITGEPLNKFIPKVKIIEKNMPIIDKMERINKELFVFNHIPVLMKGDIVGTVSTFKEVSNVIKTEREVRRSITKGHIAKYFIDDLLHESQVMKNVITITKRFANTDSTILITGETGTGKEIFAHSIHNLSRRNKEPFVSINCAALPDQLLESELFGYEEGAFTGSKKGGKPGLFEIAHKGTIFLDEISATPQNVQIRLLRVLQEKEVMRIGGDRLFPVDVRVIAAANKDLGQGVLNGEFREDLYFRLNILQIDVPPLRHRKDDIPVLVQEFIKQISDENGLLPIDIPLQYINKIMEYSWPGNVRQLRNFIERLVLICFSEFSPEIFKNIYVGLKKFSTKTEKEVAFKEHPLKEQFVQLKKENEADIIEKALMEVHFSKSKAAKKLGISRTTLWKKMKEYRLN